MALGVGMSWKASGLGASEYTKVGGNYVCCLVIICGAWRSKEVGVFEFIIQRDRGKATNKRKFYGTP